MKSVTTWLVPSLVLSGYACADLPSAARPEPLAPVFQETAWVGGQEYPAFDSEADAAAAYGPAEITTMQPYVYWEGNSALGRSEMGYTGNYGQQMVSVKAQNSKGSASETYPTTDASVFPFPRYQVTGTTRAALPGTQACGGLATVHVGYEARIVIVVKHSWLPTTLSEVFRSSGREARQPDCPSEPCPAGYTGGDGAQWSSYWLGDAWDCEQEKDEPTDDGGSGGSGPCPECVAEPTEGVTMCRVRNHYWKDTGEIFAREILWCW